MPPGGSSERARSGAFQSTRNVELPVELAARIRAYVNRRGPKILGDKTALFLDSRGKPYSERQLEKIWNRAMDASISKGLIPPEKRGAVKFGTRHAVATQRLDAGESPEVVAKALGNSPQVLLKHYDHRTTIRLRHRPGGSGTASPCAPPATTHQK